MDGRSGSIRRKRAKGLKKREEPQKGFAKLFMHGRSQAVRLPLEFRMPGTRVRISHAEGGGVLLRPVIDDIDAWFAEIDKIDKGHFLDDVTIEDAPITDDKDLFD